MLRFGEVPKDIVFICFNMAIDFSVFSMFTRKVFYVAVGLLRDGRYSRCGTKKLGYNLRLHFCSVNIFTLSDVFSSFPHARIICSR